MSQAMYLYRANIAHFPTQTQTPERDVCAIDDGALVVQDTTIVAVGSYIDMHALYPQAQVVDYRGRLLVPGFIDSHVHYAQTEMIAQYGEQLLDWLTQYTFPTEQKFTDPAYCEQIAGIFLRQLIANGTTTALAFATVHPQSVDALFYAASRLNMALISGKVCMDRHSPIDLQDTAESAQRDSADLITKWHGKNRCLYAITPRFAPTSSPNQLAALGELAQQHPNVFIQTHLSENASEVAWVKALYPEHDSYLDVYAHYGLVRKRAVFGHSLHLEPHDWAQLAGASATIAFCPSSNLFLGSGLFDLTAAQAHGVHIGLASDVGAGTSFNMLRTYGDAYKICQLKQTTMDPFAGLYAMTQGPAVAYDLAHTIGNLNPGTHADFVILNPAFNELSALRTRPASLDESAQHTYTQQHSDTLFALSMIGDDRAVEATYIAGTQQKHALEKQNALA